MTPILVWQLSLPQGHGLKSIAEKLLQMLPFFALKKEILSLRVIEAVSVTMKTFIAVKDGFGWMKFV